MVLTRNQLLVIVGSIVIMGVSLGITIGYISIKNAQVMDIVRDDPVAQKELSEKNNRQYEEFMGLGKIVIYGSAFLAVATTVCLIYSRSHQPMKSNKP